MRLAISNIAWDVNEDAAIAELLQRYSVNAIDIAPGKYFPEPTHTSAREIAELKRWWAERGFEITGMQALLFGTTGLNVFGTAESQNAMLQHLTGVCRIGSGLGATRLVFGSPKNRDRAGVNDENAMDTAETFFRRLGDVAHSYGVTVCLEPNPACYGANFMTTSAETAGVVCRVAHPAIKMQLDTGALTINNEDVVTILESTASLIGHIHGSEPNLLPLGDGGTDHAKVAAALALHLPQHIVAIEMLATQNEPHLTSVERAVQTAVRHYAQKREART